MSLPPPAPGTTEAPTGGARGPSGVVADAHSQVTEIRDLVPVYGRHVNFLHAEDHDFVELDLSLYWELGGERQQK